jgi:hypothetical protein
VFHSWNPQLGEEYISVWESPLSQVIFGKSSGVWASKLFWIPFMFLYREGKYFQLSWFMVFSMA